MALLPHATAEKLAATETLILHRNFVSFCVVRYHPTFPPSDSPNSLHQSSPPKQRAQNSAVCHTA